MPALPDVPAVLSFQFIQTLDATTNSTLKLFAKYSGTAPLNADCATMAATMFTSWGTNISPLQSVDTVLTAVRVVDLTSSTAGVGEHTGSTAGSIVSNALPAQVGYLISKTINRRYRGGKPKSFLNVGAIADLNNSQTWTTGFQTSVSAGWAALIASLVGLTWTTATISGEVSVGYYGPPNVILTNSTGRKRTVSSVNGSAGATYAVPFVDPITSTAYPLRIATQRRRTGRKR